MSGTRGIPLLPQLLCGLAVAMALVVMALRLAHPTVLEWEEGGTALSVLRLVAGERLYVEPTLDWCPFPYGGVHPLTAAAVHVLGVPALVAGRVASLLGLVLLSLAFARWAQELAVPRAVLLALGVVALGYAETGAWLDVARPDALALGWTALAASFMRPGARLPRVLLIALLASLAVHTKQTAWLPLLGAALFSRDLRATLAVLGGPALGFVLWNQLTDGWYGFHTLELLSGHELHWPGLVTFLRDDLLLWLPVLLLAGLGARRAGGVWCGLALGGGAAALLGRIHPGGFDNVLLPLLVGAAPLAAGALLEEKRSALTLLVLQAGLWFQDPAELVPSARDRAAGQAVVERVREVQGEVFAPAAPEILLAAGKPTQLHLMFLLDLSASGAGSFHAERIVADLRQRLARERYSAAVLGHFPDDSDRPLWELLRGSLPVETPLLDGDLLTPVSGAPHRPEVLLLPARP